MKTVVALKGLEFKAFHGFYDEERKKGNTFIVDVEVELKSFDSSDDNIFDTVNYEDIYTIVEDEMANTCKLIETVAYNIIQRIKEIDHIITASVKLAKMNPPIKGKCERAVVEMIF
jgi:dihydroneopterin aldolase